MPGRIMRGLSVLIDWLGLSVLAGVLPVLGADLLGVHWGDLGPYPHAVLAGAGLVLGMFLTAAILVAARLSLALFRWLEAREVAR